MELDYSGAKTLEEARAIHQAFWDNFHQEVIDGKWRVVPREEFEAHRAAMAERRRLVAEERMRQDPQNQQNRDANNDA